MSKAEKYEYENARHIIAWLIDGEWSAMTLHSRRHAWVALTRLLVARAPKFITNQAELDTKRALLKTYEIMLLRDEDVYWERSAISMLALEWLNNWFIIPDELDIKRMEENKG